ncbi:MAG: pyridoxamine 5'-phosphate oxidase family protein [Candidatus Latescibacterota bacterium]|nr:MAG: pyridoxamine 5'-phosphate oxidase family protein [Candidatus Latescibacterota bacterium]
MEQGKITLADAARALIRRTDAGVLSTHSVELEGYPFGSLTPFVASHEGRPVIFISSLAQHTKNLLADSRLCLTVFDPAEKKRQASTRVSIMGDAAPVPESELEKLSERYFAFFPSSRPYAGISDFRFYWIEPYKVRFIAGFAQIHWLEKGGWLVPTPGWKDEENHIIQHINESHANALVDMCRYFYETHPKCAQMIAADPEGFHVRADDDILYFVFERPCLTADELRTEIARMAKQSQS